MSIVRVGLSETKNFAEGYDAIFGRKKAAGQKKEPARAKTDTAKRKKNNKKK